MLSTVKVLPDVAQWNKRKRSVKDIMSGQSDEDLEDKTSTGCVMEG